MRSKFFGNEKTYFGSKNLKIIRRKIFDKQILEFLDEFSKSILKRKSEFKNEEITAAFFFRSNNLNNINKKYFNEDNRLGLGNVFHITPTNVPINFLYSFFFGLLSGNSNIVRISENTFESSKKIIFLLSKLVKKNRFKHIFFSNKIIGYDHNLNINKFYSKNSDARLIWGGDETINVFKSYDTKISCRDLVFPDRYSISYLNFDNTVSRNLVEKIAENFYNDGYFMDQNACSSPHLILWKKNKNLSHKKKLFWKKLYNVSKKKYNLSLESSFKKFEFYSKKSIEINNINSFKNYNQVLHVINLKNKIIDFTKLRGVYGMFYEIEIPGLVFLKKIISKKYQTLTYAGNINNEEINNFLFSNNINGIDRVIPVGLAHEMSFFWDGQDIIRLLTRYLDSK